MRKGQSAMDADDAELGRAFDRSSAAQAAPTPVAAPRWMMRSRPSIGDAAGDDSTAAADTQPLGAPAFAARPPRAERYANRPRRGGEPLSAHRPSSGVTREAKQEAPPNPECAIRKAMGDSTCVAVAGTAQPLSPNALPPPVTPRSKAAPKRAIDIVIELPKDVGRAIQGRSTLERRQQELSPLAPPGQPVLITPVAKRPEVTHTCVDVGDLSVTATVDRSVPRRRRESSLLESLSTTVGAMVSRIFRKGRQAPPVRDEEAADGVAGRRTGGSREVCVEVHLSPGIRPGRPPPLTSEPVILTDSGGGVRSTTERPVSLGTLSTTEVATTVTIPRVHSRKRQPEKVAKLKHRSKKPKAKETASEKSSHIPKEKKIRGKKPSPETREEKKTAKKDYSEKGSEKELEQRSSRRPSVVSPEEKSVSPADEAETERRKRPSDASTEDKTLSPEGRDEAKGSRRLSRGIAEDKAASRVEDIEAKRGRRPSRVRPQDKDASGVEEAEAKRGRRPSVGSAEKTALPAEETMTKIKRRTSRVSPKDKDASVGEEADSKCSRRPSVVTKKDKAASPAKKAVAKRRSKPSAASTEEKAASPAEERNTVSRRRPSRVSQEDMRKPSLSPQDEVVSEPEHDKQRADKEKPTSPEDKTEDIISVSKSGIGTKPSKKIKKTKAAQRREKKGKKSTRPEEDEKLTEFLSTEIGTGTSEKGSEAENALDKQSGKRRTSLSTGEKSEITQADAGKDQLRRAVAEEKDSQRSDDSHRTRRRKSALSPADGNSEAIIEGASGRVERPEKSKYKSSAKKNSVKKKSKPIVADGSVADTSTVHPRSKTEPASKRQTSKSGKKAKSKPGKKSSLPGDETSQIHAGDATGELSTLVPETLVEKGDTNTKGLGDQQGAQVADEKASNGPGYLDTLQGKVMDKSEVEEGLRDLPPNERRTQESVSERPEMQTGKGSLGTDVVQAEPHIYVSGQDTTLPGKEKTTKKSRLSGKGKKVGKLAEKLESSASSRNKLDKRKTQAKPNGGTSLVTSAGSHRALPPRDLVPPEEESFLAFMDHTKRKINHPDVVSNKKGKVQKRSAIRRKDSLAIPRLLELKKKARAKALQPSEPLVQNDGQGEDAAQGTELPIDTGERLYLGGRDGRKDREKRDGRRKPIAAQMGAWPFGSQGAAAAAFLSEATTKPAGGLPEKLVGRDMTTGADAFDPQTRGDINAGEESGLEPPPGYRPPPPPGYTADLTAAGGVPPPCRPAPPPALWLAGQQGQGAADRRMPRSIRRKRSVRQRRGPYAVGDEASKQLSPDQVKFSRIKLNPKGPEVEIHRPWSPPRSPPELTENLQRVPPDASLATGTVPQPVSKVSPRRPSCSEDPCTEPSAAATKRRVSLTPGKQERRKSSGSTERRPSIVASLLSSLASGLARRRSSSVSALSPLVPEEVMSGKESTPIKPVSRKTRRPTLKPRSADLTVEEMLSQIKKRKLGKKAMHKKKKQGSSKERVRKKRKVEKKEADTQTSFPFDEPEIPDVMFEGGDRRPCNFYFAVGLDRTVRGAMSSDDSLLTQAKRTRLSSFPSAEDAAGGNTSSVAVVQAGDVETSPTVNTKADISHVEGRQKPVQKPKRRPKKIKPKPPARRQKKIKPEPAKKMQQKHTRKQKKRKTAKGKPAPSSTFLFERHPSEALGADSALERNATLRTRSAPNFSDSQTSPVFCWMAEGPTSQEPKLFDSALEAHLTRATDRKNSTVPSLFANRTPPGLGELSGGLPGDTVGERLPFEEQRLTSVDQEAASPEYPKSEVRTQDETRTSTQVTTSRLDEPKARKKGRRKRKRANEYKDVSMSSKKFKKAGAHKGLGKDQKSQKQSKQKEGDKYEEVRSSNGNTRSHEGTLAKRPNIHAAKKPERQKNTSPKRIPETSLKSADDSNSDSRRPEIKSSRSRSPSTNNRASRSCERGSRGSQTSQERNQSSESRRRRDDLSTTEMRSPDSLLSEKDSCEKIKSQSMRSERTPGRREGSRGSHSRSRQSDLSSSETSERELEYSSSRSMSESVSPSYHKGNAFLGKRQRHRKKGRSDGHANRERNKAHRKRPSGSSVNGSISGYGVVNVQSTYYGTTDYSGSHWHGLMWCGLLFLAALLITLLVLGSSVIFFALKTSPAPLVQRTRTQAKAPTFPQPLLIKGAVGVSTPFLPVPGALSYCDTAFCSREAHYIVSLLQSDDRSCDDFYEYACSKWLGQRSVEAGDAELVLSQSAILEDSLALQLLAFISNSTEPDVQTAANLYSACELSNGDILSAEGEAVVQTMFHSWEIGQWPRTSADGMSHLSVWQFAAELARDLDLATLLEVTVVTDPYDSDATILELKAAQPLLNASDRDFGQLFKSAIAETVLKVGKPAAFDSDDFVERLINVSAALQSAIIKRESEENVTVLRGEDLGERVRHFVDTLLVNVRGTLASHTLRVAVMSPEYVRADLQNTLLSVSALDTLNYMGFLVLVRVAPFLPDELRSLRALFARNFNGRAVDDADNRPILCLWLVEHAFPGCFAKAWHRLLEHRQQEVVLRQWLSYLQASFVTQVAEFPWMGNLSSLMLRYHFNRRVVTLFDPFSDGRTCAPVTTYAPNDPPLSFYLNVSGHRFSQRLRGLLGNGRLLRRRGGGDVRSELRSDVTYDRPLRLVHVPAALFNLSVPTNTQFAFHLARVAVRLYRAMLRVLHENPNDRYMALSLTDEARHRLAALADCFGRDAQGSPRSLRDAWTPPVHGRQTVGKILLDQNMALLLALRAFNDVLPKRKSREADYRLHDLPDKSAQQLFFVYYALDNCESTPAAFRRRSGVPAKVRVNLALRHTRQFSQAFECSPTDSMTPSAVDSCDVLRRNVK